MVLIVSDVARLAGEPGGVIRKMGEGYLDAVEGALTKAYREKLLDRVIGINRSVVYHFCEHRAGKCFRDGSYFKDAVAVLDVHQGIIPSLNSHIFL